MDKYIISEGKTTAEAIENGLNKLKVSKNDVEIEILKDENKKSFFSILTPRNVRVKLILKEKKEGIKEYKEKDDIISETDFYKIKENINNFLTEFFNETSFKNINFEIINEKNNVKVDIYGENVNILIGYRGETLNAFQIILSRVGNKGLENKHRIILDIEGYREKRIKVLENLAVKVSNTVEKNKKSITLEPMSAFERKIIHNKLQENPEITTHSIGREPNRRIVIELKK